MFWQLWFGLLLPLLFVSNIAMSMKIDDALSMSLKNSLTLKEQKHNIDKSISEHNIIEGAFDLNTFASARYIDDQSDSPYNPFMGESRKQSHFDVGLKKLFSTGTAIQFSLNTDKYEVNMDDKITSLIANPMVAGMMASFGPQFNPAHVTKVELKVIQNLWRNFNAKEIKLAKEVASMGVVQSSYAHKIMQQAIQFETEILYWKAVALENKLKTQRQLVLKAKEFARLMAQRIKLGRADPVDQATADAMVVTQETIYLNLENVYEQVKTKLLFNIKPESDGQEKIILISKLDHPDIPTEFFSSALKTAYDKRFDLAMISDSLKPLEARKRLAKEGNKPNLALFGSAAYSGLDDGFSNSFDKAMELKKPTYGVGLSFDMPVNGTKPYNELEASAAAISALNMKKLQLQSDIKRDVDMVIKELEAANKQIKQNIFQVQNLEKKWKGEKHKLQQARTEMVVVIRYEMELLAASHDRISAQEAKRVALGKIKFITHSYPTN